MQAHNADINSSRLSFQEISARYVKLTLANSFIWISMGCLFHAGCSLTTSSVKQSYGRGDMTITSLKSNNSCSLESINFINPSSYECIVNNAGKPANELSSLCNVDVHQVRCLSEVGNIEPVSGQSVAAFIYDPSLKTINQSSCQLGTTKHYKGQKINVKYQNQSINKTLVEDLYFCKRPISARECGTPLTSLEDTNDTLNLWFNLKNARGKSIKAIIYVDGKAVRTRSYPRRSYITSNDRHRAILTFSLKGIDYYNKKITGIILDEDGIGLAKVTVE